MKGIPQSELVAPEKAVPPDNVYNQPFSGRCIHQLFEEQAAATPHAPAVVFGDRQLSYGELNEQANQLAVFLRGQGVKAGSLVGLCLARSTEMVVAVLGILKAGGAYVPLDPAYPKDRLAFMLADAAPVLVLTQQSLLSELPQHQLPTVCLDTSRELMARNVPINLPPSRQPDDLAYVLYTSGSTGRPKGVAMPHGPLVNLISWQAGSSKLVPGARTLQFASLNFDVSFQEIFSTFCTGGALVIAPQALRDEPGRLLECLGAEKIARLFLPVVALQLLAEIAEVQDQLPGSLREVITAGEQLRISPSIRRLFERLGTCRLHNHYGPTESHVVTAYTLSGPPQNWSALPPIGRPISNAEIRLLDPQLQPVPAGEPGELYIGGEVLARGYLHQPEMTAARFIADPFPGQPGARLYKTGDLARLLPDGNLEYLGRNDDQVKIRGYRVELGEIESALLQHPDVCQAVVAAEGGTGGDRRLVAYVVAADATKMAPSDLREFLRNRLPDHMVPARFVALPAFPLTPSGKVDRRALPQQTTPAPGALAAPASELERQVLAIWREVLQVTVAGLDDNFFELGGNSINLAQVHLRLQKILGREFPITDLFAHTTIRLLAAHFGRQSSSAETVAALQNRSQNQRNAFSQFRTRRP